MRVEQMTLHNIANPLQIFANRLQEKRERFVKLCNQWDSAEDLADDLCAIGYEVSPRTVANWRNRTATRIPMAAVMAVQYAAEHLMLQDARDRARRLQEEIDAL